MDCELDYTMNLMGFFMSGEMDKSYGSGLNALKAISERLKFENKNKNRFFLPYFCVKIIIMFKSIKNNYLKFVVDFKVT